MANPKANCKCKIREDEIKAFRFSVFKWISRSVGQILFTTGYSLFKRSSGRRGTAEDEPEMI